MLWPLWKLVCRFLNKLKIELSITGVYPAIPLLGIQLKKRRTLIPKDSHTPVSTVALFTITKIWKQPKGSSTDEWIKRCGVYINMYVIYTQWNTTQPQKKNESFHLQQYGWTWSVLCLVKLDRERQILYDANYMWNLKNKAKY